MTQKTSPISPIMYGTDADGLPVDELPVGWWDDDAVDWAPDLGDDDTYVDPWELDQADLDHAHLDEQHGDSPEADARAGERRSRKML